MTVSAERVLRKLTLTNLQQFCICGMLFSICLFRLGRVMVGGSAALAPVKLFFAMGMLLWIANIIISRDTATILRLLRNEANVLYILFLGVSFLSVVCARYSGAITASEFVDRIQVYCSFLVVLGVVKDRRILRIAILALILGSVLTSMIGLYELVTGRAFFKYTFRMGIMASHPNAGLALGGGGRVQGLSSDPGLHGFVMAVFLGLTLPWVFFARSNVTKSLAAAFLTICFVNLIGTGTRSSWLAWACAFSLFVVFLRHRHKYLIVVGSALLCILVFLTLALLPNVPTFERLNFFKSVSLGWRTDTYFEALQMMKKHPFLGIGTGSYLYEYHNYLSERPGLSRYFYGWLHNSYLQIWVENGAIGFALYLMLMLNIVLGVLDAYMRARDREMRAIALGLLLGLAGHAVCFAAMPILYQELGGFLLGLSAACASVARAESRSPSAPAAAVPSRE